MLLLRPANADPRTTFTNERKFVMDHGLHVLRTHPNKPSQAVEACAQACLDCFLACTACADACLSEPGASSLTDCIRLNLNCAAVCAATVPGLASSGSFSGRAPLKAQLAACAAACASCASECQKHAGHHSHCAHCAEACKLCLAACEATIKALQ
jgi:hypothetical protein